MSRTGTETAPRCGKARGASGAPCGTSGPFVSTRSLETRQRPRHKPGRPSPPAPAPGVASRTRVWRATPGAGRQAIARSTVGLGCAAGRTGRGTPRSARPYHKRASRSRTRGRGATSASRSPQEPQRSLGSRAAPQRRFPAGAIPRQVVRPADGTPPLATGTALGRRGSASHWLPAAA